MDLVVRATWFPYGDPRQVERAIPRVPMAREAIVALEAAAEALPLEWRQDQESRTHHHFWPGVYVREYRMNAGDMVIGKIHKHPHGAMLVSGRAAIATERGPEQFEGPQFFDSFPGCKRAVWALTDAVFITIHPNPSDTRDLRAIEDEVIAPSFEAFEQFQAEQKLLARGAA